jgi:hypothetical protein
MLTIARTYGFDKLTRFFAVFLPRHKPFPFRISSEEQQATFFVAALSSAVGEDLRPMFLDLGFPIEDSIYDQIKNVTDVAAAFRDPNPQPCQLQIVEVGSTVQLNGTSSFDVFQNPLTYNWTLISRPPQSNSTLNARDTGTPTFVADVLGEYAISLRVSNGLLISPSREATVLAGISYNFSTSSEYDVQIVSNSTISDFQFNGTAIIFNVSGKNGTSGFCEICIPTAMMNNSFTVYVDGANTNYDLLPCSNSTYSYLYFNYALSTKEVIIVPEFPSFLILPLFIIVTLFAVTFFKRKHLFNARAST